MRPAMSAAFAALLLAGCAAYHEAPGPAGMAYACSDGHAVRVAYEGGGYFPRATARLVRDGRTTELAAVPSASGLRYVGEAEGAVPASAWSVRGEEAWLSALDADHGEEREIAHCTRLRSAGAEDHHRAEPAH